MCIHDLFEMAPTLFRKLADDADKFLVSTPSNFISHCRSDLLSLIIYNENDSLRDFLQVFTFVVDIL